MTATRRRSGIRVQQGSIQGRMARGGPRETLIGGGAKQLPAPVQPEPLQPPALPMRAPPAALPAPAVCPRPLVRGQSARDSTPAMARQPARRHDVRAAPAARTPSKLTDLRATIARQQQRIDELENKGANQSARRDDLQERVDTVLEILDEIVALIAKPDGVANRRRLRLRIEEIVQVLS